MAVLLTIFALLYLASCTSSFPSLILDTDIGTDFDDSWAMTYLLSKSIQGAHSQKYSFLLVQCSTFNTTDRARIAAKMMFDMGRFDVPIGVGKYTGEQTMRQLPAADGFSLNDFVSAGGTVYYGTEKMAEILATGTPSNPIYVVEIAPATSLGSVVSANPTLANNVLLSAMSGSVYHGYGNRSSPSAEYNVKTDIPASQHMYNSTWVAPLLMTPLDTSGLLHCIAPEFNALFAANNSAHKYAQTLIKNYIIWVNSSTCCNNVSDILYDAQAAWSLGYYDKQFRDGMLPNLPSLTFQQLPIVSGREWLGGGHTHCHVLSRLKITPPPSPHILHFFSQAVTNDGYTNITSSATKVFSAVYFSNGPGTIGLINASHTICGEIINSIVAAG